MARHGRVGAHREAGVQDDHGWLLGCWHPRVRVAGARPIVGEQLLAGEELVPPPVLAIAAEQGRGFARQEWNQFLSDGPPVTRCCEPSTSFGVMPVGRSNSQEHHDG